MKTIEKPIRTYIASPYSPTSFVQKLPVVKFIIHYLRARQVTKVTARLLESHNIAPICPITQSHQIAKFLKNKDGGFDKWKNIDYSYIDGCSQLFVIMLKGWGRSTGVRAEIEYARRKGLAILYYDSCARLKGQETKKQKRGKK